MRIAFVGKGGSGKTTVSALFSLYLDSLGKKVGLLDVDVNSHTAEVIGLDYDGAFDLSQDAVSADIRRYLIGSRRNITEYDFLNSTPPATGSQFFSLDPSNYITRTYGRPFGVRGRMFTTGSYKEHSIGIDCHHSTQYIAENLLSHTRLGNDEVLVIDSVAGNDAFGNSLYLQDLLVIVVKPEREGVKVFERFYELATKAGVADRVYALGNQVTTDRQEAFLRKSIDASRLIGILPVDNDIVDARLDDVPLQACHITSEKAVVFDAIFEAASRHVQSPVYYYEKIVALHEKLAGEGWVIGSYRPGMEDQIDRDYKVSV